MSNTLNILEKHSVNGVLPLKKLKKDNYPLFKYVVNNLIRVSKELLDEKGVSILDDRHTLRDPDKIKLYLRYHYGQEVNLSELRLIHRTIYNYLTQISNPLEAVISLGFTPVYNHTNSDDMIKSKLQELAYDGNKVRHLKTGFYNRIYYRANKEGLTVKEYLEKLGYEYRDVEDEDIVSLRDKKGLSFGKIAEKYGLPKSTIYSRYKRLKQE